MTGEIEVTVGQPKYSVRKYHDGENKDAQEAWCGQRPLRPETSFEKRREHKHLQVR